MLKQLINGPQSPWTQGTGMDKDVVLCTRIRLARNLAKVPFPLKQTPEAGQMVLRQMEQFCQRQGNLHFLEMQQLSPLEKQVLVEKHLISPEHGRDDGRQRGLAVSQDGNISIMINEEDHLRLQCFAPGLDVEALWRQASLLDDQMEESLPYAFDARLGYLTCCPTNLGNGMRVSVMMHLPGLTMTRRLSMLDQLSKVGMTVRGLFGEGSKSLGALYQISNQNTIGQREQDVLVNLQSVTQQIIREERAARSFLKEQSGLQLSDQIWRAYGTLRYARTMHSREAMELIGQVRMGYDLGYFSQLTLPQIDQLYLQAQPAYLQSCKGQQLAETERDICRAEQLRALLAQ